MTVAVPLGLIVFVRCHGLSPTPPWRTVAGIRFVSIRRDLRLYFGLYWVLLDTR
jgi:hypothetical protein